MFFLEHSLLSHSNYSCYGTFIALFYRKIFPPEATVGNGRTYPTPWRRSFHCSDEKNFSATRNKLLQLLLEVIWKKFSGVVYLIITQVTNYDSFRDRFCGSKIVPPEAPIV
ncbi:hypothetical protein CEXT_35541 [Caerostris extrusa]|uniref:Uncharacterized protein n=1 Tax=Caerostris extrusa TaxID=172846 RepID=A0AAV4UH94_CAEEX|nr:hypothetical protein CEXT_35541 [Caerostris extrusa]